MKLPPLKYVPCKSAHIDPANKRGDMSLKDLKASIAHYGILQPPGLRYDPGRGCYFVIWGNRRVLCAQELGHEEIPAFVFDRVLQPCEIAVYRAIENEQRLDLKPSERGRTYQELMELQQVTAKEVAEQLQISAPTVSRHLAILSLPTDILALIDDGNLPLSTGVSLARLPDEETRRDLVRQILESSMTRAQLEETVKTLGAKNQPATRLERVSYKVGDAKVTVAARGLTLTTFTRTLKDLLREARKIEDAGQDLNALAAHFGKDG